MNNTGFKFSWYVDQRALLEFNETFNTNLDDRDFAIILMLSEFAHTTYCEKSLVSTTIYYKFHWKLVTTQLPIFSIKSKKGVHNRYQKLVDAKLLVPQIIYSGAESKTFFRFGENFQYLFNSKVGTKEPERAPKCPLSGNESSYYNTNNNNKVSKEPENYINDHDRITKEISSYLETDAGRQQKAYWLSTTMFSCNFDEALSSFIDWYYGKDDMSFINNPLRFLNKKMVYWLRNKKTSAYAKDKAPNKSSKPETLESYYKECKKTVNQIKHLLKRNKDKYQAFLKNATLKQTVFEYSVLFTYPFESSEYTRKSILNMFMKDVTEWQKNNFTSKQMMEKFKKFVKIKNFR